MQYIKFFSELTLNDIPLAGGKGASLGEMTQAGFPVPTGFCLTTEAYTAFVEANQLQAKILAHAAQDEHEEATIRALFANAVMPEAIFKELAATLAKLSASDNSTTVMAYAVRSSATAEDLPGASFAGQQDTYLNIQGIDAIKVAVQNCWGSLWTDRAIIYRQREQIAPADVSMAVVVQELISAESAGVLFTANPVTGSRNETVINAAWGLGEAVVSGLVTPDTLIVDKATGIIKSAQIADKQIMTVRTAGGSLEQPVPDAQRRQPVLKNGQVGKLVELGLAVEKHAGRPMDLEWGIVAGEVYLLQARPITALPPEVIEPDLHGMEWSRLMLIERYPDPITPFTWSITSEMLFSAFGTTIEMMGGDLPADAPPMIQRIYGRPYINVTLLNQGFASSPARPPVELEDGETAPASRPTLKELPKLLLILARLGNLLRTTHRQWERMQTPFEQSTQQAAAYQWEQFDSAELLTRFNQEQAKVAPLLENHAYSIISAELSLQLLQSLTRKWLGDEDKHLATTMLSGLTGNKTVQTNHDLWQLAVQVRANDPLKALIAAPLTADWRTQIAAVPAGATFLAKLDQFLQTYGHRSPRYEMMHAPWVEDPMQLLALLRLYLDPSVLDPNAGLLRQAAAREAAVADARQRLSLPRRLVFDRVLPLAQTYFRLRENQQFYLLMGLPTVRRILAILGQRLQAAGKLQAAEDIYFLEVSEVLALAAQLAGISAETIAPTNPIQLTTDRRALLQHYNQLHPTVTLGGNPKAITEPVSANKLHGIAASRGLVTGKARIVQGPADFGKLQAGEILVTPATTPAWTPLFGVAAGLVTDYGGLLSHSGVVAREYGLPAVLGTDNATQRIKNGDEITVDGDRGIVLL